MADVEVTWRARVRTGEADLTRVIRNRIRTAFGSTDIGHFEVVVLGITRNGKPDSIVRKAAVDTQEGVSMNIWVQGGQGIDCIVIPEEGKLSLLLECAQSLSLPQKKAQRAQENKKKPKKPKTSQPPRSVDHMIRLKRKPGVPTRRAPRKEVEVVIKKAAPVIPVRPLERLSVMESSGITRSRSTLSLPLRVSQ